MSPEGTTEMPPSATPAQSKFLSSLRDFWAGGSNPTDESVGYDQSSLRDSDRQPAASTPPVGEDAKACLYSTENGEEPCFLG